MAVFPSIKIEGGLLGPDLLDQVLGAELPGQKPADFGLDSRRNLTDEIAAAFADARALWGVFQNRLERLPESDIATTVTRDAWMIPFLGLLGYAPTFNQRAYEIDGLSFAISHRADEAEKAPPVHIVGFRQELGRVPASGRPRLAPHSLVQEFLNRTENLWGIVTNGRILRLLRDCSYIRRQAYIEFDLQAMLEEQRFQDFAALYRLLHRTRLPRTDETARDCLLEKYYEHSIEQGGRVRDRLRDGVEQCILRLANGFLRHPASDDLRRRLAPDCPDNDRISPEDFYRQLLRLVYRSLFLLVSEDRGLLSTDPLYREHYGIARLRRLLDNRAAFTEHDDLWQSLRVLWYVLNNDTPQPALNNRPMAAALGLPVLNGELFAPQPLDNASISNHDLLDGFFYLAKYEPARGTAWQRVNYAALDVEELGSVYESLLEFHPAVQRDPAGRLTFDLVFGSERKSTGSYYTPPELVGELIKSALEPVLADRLNASPKDREKAILSIRVCDPACGSGHFLLAAARRLGKELARVRTGEDEPAPERVREAVRDVVSHCIYGVDKNPLAVDLCRVALWLESHTASKPLTFLDHRIRCGDSLVGVFDLDVLARGIPDEAFAPREGDDRAAASEARRRNRSEREQSELFTLDIPAALAELARQARGVDAVADESPEAIRRKRGLYESTRHSPATMRLRELCDLWTAAFFQPLARDRAAPPPITTGVLFERAAGRPPDARTLAAAATMALSGRFFHWPLEFPEVFAEGGFDVVLGNPPWERIKLQEKEWFAQRSPQIAAAPNAAARRRLIDELQRSDPQLHAAFRAEARRAECESHFVRSSERYPLCGRGDVNTYQLFAEHNRALMGPRGRAGFIVPSGIATDDTTKHFFRDLMERQDLVSLFDFENRAGIFPAVDSRMKFCLLTLGGGRGEPRLPGGGVAAGDASPLAAPHPPPQFAFFLHNVRELADPGRVFSLTAEDLALLNPNTRTCPIFRTQRDAELTRRIYRRVAELSPDGCAVLVQEADPATGRPERNPWGVRFLRMFDMSNDSHLFRTRAQLEQAGGVLRGNVFHMPDGETWLPLYEAKMVGQFNHRSADVVLSETAIVRQGQPDVIADESLADALRFSQPRYWVAEVEVRAWQSRLQLSHWLMGWRDITSTTNERTVVPAAIPLTAVGDKFLLLVIQDAMAGAWLLASLNSFALDFVARQKVGGISLKFFTFKQLAVPPPIAFEQTSPWQAPCSVGDWIVPRLLELTYTAHDLGGFAADCGWKWPDGTPKPPFRWDEQRRFVLRAQLDAAFFQLYGLSRDDARYILSTFPIVNRKDRQRWGFDRTAAAILHYYDALAECQRSGRAFESNDYAQHRRALGWPVYEGEHDGILEGDGDWTGLRLDSPILPIDCDLPRWRPGEPRPAGWPAHVHPPREVAASMANGAAAGGVGSGDSSVSEG